MANEVKMTATISDQQVKEKLPQIERRMRSFFHGMERMAQGGRSMLYGFMGINNFTYGIGAFLMLVGKAFSMLTGLAEKLKHISDEARALNISTDAFQSLTAAARKAGVDMVVVTNLIQRLGYSVSQAANGNKSLIDSFHALGISVVQFEQLAPEERLLKLVAAVRQLKEEGKDWKTAAGAVMGGRYATRSFGAVESMVEKNFDILYAQAKMNGFVADRTSIEAGKNLITSMGDLNDQVVKACSNFVMVSKAMELLTAAATKISSNFTSRMGFEEHVANLIGGQNIWHYVNEELTKRYAIEKSGGQKMAEWLLSIGADPELMYREWRGERWPWSS